MHYFKAAQPALLYLVPTCLLTPLFVALCRGELGALWHYSEEHLVEKHEKEKEKEKTKPKEKSEKEKLKEKKTK
uniref:Secreted protein n=1 Tax=Ditylenchus dipsaci TaxID=166011 RepID=A0A915DP46_9BILA